MTGRLFGQTVVITGAGRGLGRAAAVGMAQEGANIVIADIDEDNSNEVAKEINNIGCQSLVVKTDVSNELSE